jgi:hypothetical protein
MRDNGRHPMVTTDSATKRCIVCGCNRMQTKREGRGEQEGASERETKTSNCPIGRFLGWLPLQ